MKKYMKLVMFALLALSVLFSFAACGVSDDKAALRSELTALQGEYDELTQKRDALSSANTALNNENAILRENSKTFFNLQTVSACIISAPMYFTGAASWENPYADLSSPNADYTVLPYAQSKTPVFTPGRYFIYRYTCLFTAEGIYTLRYSFTGLNAIDMNSSIRAYVITAKPKDDGTGFLPEQYNLFLSADSGADGISMVFPVTTARVNMGYTCYLGFFISNNGSAPVFEGKAFSVDSVTIQVR